MSCGRELLSVGTQRFAALFGAWELLFDSAYPAVSAWYFPRVGHGVGRGRAQFAVDIRYAGDRVVSHNRAAEKYTRYSGDRKKVRGSETVTQ